MAEDQHQTKLVISPERIRARVSEVASDICRDLSGKDVVLLGILKGAFVFLGDLARSMPVPMEVDFIRLASYGQAAETSGLITLSKEPELDLKGRTVVVVEDIVDSGLTMRWLLNYLRQQGVEDARVCTFIDKSERREVQVPVHYSGFTVPRGFLVGYGLDYNEKYRNLPGLYELVF